MSGGLSVRDGEGWAAGMIDAARRKVRHLRGGRLGSDITHAGCPPTRSRAQEEQLIARHLMGRSSLLATQHTVAGTATPDDPNRAVAALLSWKSRVAV